jgi:hypothetical protein
MGGGVNRMFHFKAETNADLANEAFHAPNSIKWAHDDTHKGKFTIPYNPNWLYLSCYVDGIYCGCVFGLPTPEGDLSFHIAFLPRIFGRSSILGKSALGWLKVNVPEYRRYWASIAPYNTLTKRFVEKIGFVYHHHDKSGWLVDGVEHGKDVYLYSV